MVPLLSGGGDGGVGGVEGRGVEGVGDAIPVSERNLNKIRVVLSQGGMENGLRQNMFLYRLTNFICLSVVGFTKHEGPGMLFCLQGSEMRLWNPIQAISPK